MSQPQRKNLGIDLGFLERIAADASSYRRMKLARELGAFVVNRNTDPSEREAVGPILLRLMNDPVTAVRHALVAELESARRLPPDLIFAVAADDAEIVLSFLARSPAIRAKEMAAIARIGDPARQVAIAERRDVSPEAVDALAKRGAPMAVAALIRNEAVSIPERSYEILLSRFGGDSDFLEMLFERVDLPMNIRIRVARKRSDRVKLLLGSRGIVADQEAGELVSDAEEIVFLSIAKGSCEDERAALVRYLADNKLLTASLLARAICFGDIAFVEESLAYLAGMPLAQLRNILHGDNFLNVRAICSHCDLPPSCHVLVRLAVETRHMWASLGGPENKGFARAMIETLASDGAGLAPAEKARALAMIARYGPGDVKELAYRLKRDVAVAA